MKAISANDLAAQAHEHLFARRFDQAREALRLIDTRNPAVVAIVIHMLVLVCEMELLVTVARNP